MSLSNTTENATLNEAEHVGLGVGQPLGGGDPDDGLVHAATNPSSGLRTPLCPMLATWV